MASPLALPRLFRRQRLDRQRVDLAPHELTERAVDDLVARQTALASKLTRDHARGEMGIVLGGHLDLRSGEPGADQPRNCFGVHGRDITWAACGRAYNEGMDSQPVSASASQ